MDLTDTKAWDDSELINTWDEALEEYKKYHSIHLSGKRLEDVLTKEEMSQVYAQRRALRQKNHEPLTEQEVDEKEEGEYDDEQEMSISPERELAVEVAFQDSGANERTTEAEHPHSNTNGTYTASSLPPMPAMVGVQDENLKNLLMAWYYAGYHTGLYEGRQQAINELSYKAKS